MEIRQDNLSNISLDQDTLAHYLAEGRRLRSQAAWRALHTLRRWFGGRATPPTTRRAPVLPLRREAGGDTRPGRRAA